MPGAIRKGDLSTADPCGAPPRAPAQWSSNVFINGQNVVRVGDAYQDHACPGDSPHSATATGGSSTVFINGKSAHRIGDSISCGSSGANGSSNVIIG